MILSVDDGCASDLRVADLARKYEIETIFYWPVEWYSLAFDKGYTPLSIDEAYDIAGHFEIGSHGLTHRYLTQIGLDEAKMEIWESKIRLMKMFDQPINSFCFPRGYSNEVLNTFTLNHYKSYRLTKGLDSYGNKLVHVHPNSGANDNKPWRECITENTHLWMHSFDLDRFSLWDELESVMAGYVTV